NSTSTTNVAPCSFCAGPNTSPRKLWAIMKWSRTLTVYIVVFPATLKGSPYVRRAALSGPRVVTNPVTDRISRRGGQLRHGRRELVERALTGNERVELVVSQERQRERHTAARVPSGALRAGDVSNLRGFQR